MSGTGEGPVPSAGKKGGWAPLFSFFLVALAVGMLVADAASRGQAARSEGLEHLQAESRERAREMEGLLAGLDRTLAQAAEMAGESGSLDPGDLSRAVRETTTRSDTLLYGSMALDTSRQILWADPEALAQDAADAGIEEAAVEATASASTIFRSGFLWDQTHPGVTLARAVRNANGELLGFLLLVVELEPGSEVWPDPTQSLMKPTSMVLDSLGRVLSHPRRSWVGRPLFSGRDSLYDPQLWEILPQILRSQEGSWPLTSEFAAPGSWMRGLETFLATAPVYLPNGEQWHLVLTASERPGPIPLVPQVIHLGGLPTLLAAFFLGTALLLLLRPPFPLRGGGDTSGDAWYRTLVEAGPDGLAVLGGGDRVVTANDAFARMAGIPKESLEGKHLGDILDSPDPEKAAEVRDLLRTGRAEARLRRPDGTLQEVEIHTAELALGSEAFLLSLFRDLTWRRGVERETLRVGERERLLLGKELHDGLGQHLTGVAFMAKTLAAKLVDSGEPGAQDAVRIGQLVKDAVGQIRVLAKGLELAEYEARELPQALGEMSEVVRRLMGVDLEVDLDLDGGDGATELDTFLTTQLYRLCHEVVSDAVRNRLAQKIRVTIRREGDRILLVAHHDGEPPREDRETGSALPFYRLRYRARLLDATLTVSEGEEGGTTVACSFEVGGDRE